MPDQYVHLYLALERTGKAGEKVSGTREPPAPLSVDVEALMRDVITGVTQWVPHVAAAAGITGQAKPRQLGPDVRLRKRWTHRSTVELEPDGTPARDEYDDLIADDQVVRAGTVEVINRPDSTTGVALTSACRTLAAHVDVLLGLPAVKVWEWDDEEGTDGQWVPVRLDGAAAAGRLLELRGRIRAALGETRGRDHLRGVECRRPECAQKTLYREHGTDVIECDSCGDEWSYDELQRWTRMLAGEVLTRRKGAADGGAGA
ncbi:MAG: hypothetical protein LC798_10755 [Chloroflexi bacterium]|nr:hypothetical protein [Chloroflexota bacterium]